jgi:hypothetical protein
MTFGLKPSAEMLYRASKVKQQFSRHMFHGIFVGMPLVLV